MTGISLRTLRARKIAALSLPEVDLDQRKLCAPAFARASSVGRRRARWSGSRRAGDRAHAAFTSAIGTFQTCQRGPRCPLSGIDRKSSADGENDAFDPKRKFALSQDTSQGLRNRVEAR